MNAPMSLEPVFLRMPRGLASRFRIVFYRLLGMKIGHGNRIEGKGRCRRLSQIQLGDYNALTQGCWLWPIDAPFTGRRIKIGSGNYFNRNLMIDACGYVEIGDNNMFGPDVYIADSNHTFGGGVAPHKLPMDVGKVRIGNNCWIGAHTIILKDVELGDGCVVGAGAVVTKSFAAGAVIAGVPAKALREAE
jgi:acetyltransferase-like isoleucine patch superfamily enzyme